jgi:hypothetical protein
MRKHFSLEADYVQLNHGSFGAVPTVVQQAHRALSELAEQNPDRWIQGGRSHGRYLSHSDAA